MRHRTSVGLHRPSQLLAVSQPLGHLFAHNLFRGVHGLALLLGLARYRVVFIGILLHNLDLLFVDYSMLGAVEGLALLLEHLHAHSFVLFDDLLVETAAAALGALNKSHVARGSLGQA